MKNLILTALAAIVASCASTTPTNTSTPTGQVVELDPFKFKSQIVRSGGADNFRIHDIIVEDVPTRIELYSGKSPGDDYPDHRILETRPALVVTVHYDEGSERDDVGWYDKIDLVVPADRLPPELTAQLRELSDKAWWRPIDNRRKRDRRTELAGDYVTLEVRESSKDVQVIDANRAFARPKSYVIEPLSGRGVDGFVVLRRTVKEVTLVTEPPMSGLTAESYDD